jgi:hypothetical protein
LKKRYLHFISVIIAVVLLLSSFFRNSFNRSFEQTTHQVSDTSSCPPEGNAQTERLKELNKLKNRILFPGKADFDTTITLEKIFAPGDDKNRWTASKAVRITGYIYEVKPGGTETCNCKAKEKDKKDSHIEMVTDPMSSGKMNRFIMEVTPRIRKILNEKGENWTTSALRDKLLGRWVEVEGWLFFDEEHSHQAENTAPDKPNNWRATAWEIHPVTNFKIVQRPVKK